MSGWLIGPTELAGDGWFVPGEITSAHVEPFEGSEIDPRSLEITGIHVDVGGKDAASARFAGWRVAAIRAGAFDFVQKEAADLWPLQAAVTRASSPGRLGRSAENAPK